MGDEEKLKIIIEAQNKAKAAFDEAQKQIDDTGKKFSGMGDKMDAAGEKMKSVGKKMTTYMTLPILAGAGMSIKAFSDLEETLSKVDVTFGKSSASVKKWADTSIEKMGLAKQTALDATALFGDMGTGMGMNQKEAAKMGMGLTQLGADMASFKNVSIDRAQTALAGVYTGETEALKSLGVVMTETNLAEFAASKGITKKISDMTQAEKVQLRYNFVMDKTKNAQGDFARTSDSLANKTRTAKEKTKELSATLGEKLAPVYNKLLEVGTKVLDWFGKLSGKQQKWILYIGIALAVLGPLVTIIGTLATVIGFLITPVGLIVAGIALLVAGLVYAYFKFEAFRNVVDTVFRFVVSFIKEFLYPAFLLFWSTVATVFEAIVSIISFAWGIIKPIWDLFYAIIANVLIPVIKLLWAIVSPIFTLIWLAIKSMWDFAQPYIQELIDAWGRIQNALLIAWDWIDRNIISKISGIIDWVAKFTEKLGKAIDAVKDFLQLKNETSKKEALAEQTISQEIYAGTFGRKTLTPAERAAADAAYAKYGVSRGATIGKPKKKASGGPLSAGDWSWVGERGPELIHMPRNGMVYSNQQSMASATNTFTGNIILGDASAVKEFFKKLDRDADRASMGVPV